MVARSGGGEAEAVWGGVKKAEVEADTTYCLESYRR
jgi:hypothetical protein